MNDADFILEVEEIVNFALPKIKEELDSGRELYDFVENQLKIYPIGILPLNSDAGYMFIDNGKHSDTKVFTYEITLFTGSNEKYRAIKTQLIDTYIKQFSNTYENIKHDLIKKNKNLPNPATFLISSQHTFPLYETLLPIAKRSLVRMIAKGIS